MVQEQVKRAFEKKASLQEMFERRRVSLKKLAAKQTRPVQPVAPRPESLSSPGIYLSVYLSVCLSVCLSACLSACLSVCLFVYQV